MDLSDLGQLIGEGKEAEVFLHGENVLKLYRQGAAKSAAFREAAILAIVERSGLPAPAVSQVGMFDGRWGLVMSRAAGRPFAEAMLSDPGQVAPYLEAMALLHRQIHACSGTGLPGLSARLRANLGKAAGLPDVLRDRLLQRLAALPGGDSICHGDFHPYNIIGTPGQAVVVDWLDACAGAPAADLCRSFLLLGTQSPPLADAYLDACEKAGGPGRLDVLAWLPVLAAARLTENVPHETDRLLAMAEQV